MIASILVLFRKMTCRHVWLSYRHTGGGIHVRNCALCPATQTIDTR